MINSVIAEAKELQCISRVVSSGNTATLGRSLFMYDISGAPERLTLAMNRYP